MKKILLSVLVAISIIGGIVLSFIMMKKENNNYAKEEYKNIEIAEKITDECIDEYNELQEANVQEANSEEEKVSPNAVITFKIFYKKCEHTIEKKEKISNSLVNATQKEIEEKYDKWKLQEFSKEKIVLQQEINEECGEHYMLRDVDGKINVYKLDENGNESLLNETDIATEYLTETDMINMENGLIVYGKENLNKLLEDYE